MAYELILRKSSQPRPGSQLVAQGEGQGAYVPDEEGKEGELIWEDDIVWQLYADHVPDRDELLLQCQTLLAEHHKDLVCVVVWPLQENPPAGERMVLFAATEGTHRQDLAYALLPEYRCEGCGEPMGAPFINGKWREAGEALDGCCINPLCKEYLAPVYDLEQDHEGTRGVNPR